MSEVAAGWLQAGVLVLAVVLTYRPLGDYMARVFTSEQHGRVELGLNRLRSLAEVWDSGYREETNYLRISTWRGCPASHRFQPDP